MRVSVDNLVMHHAEAVGTDHAPRPGVITGPNGAAQPPATGTGSAEPPAGQENSAGQGETQ